MGNTPPPNGQLMPQHTSLDTPQVSKFQFQVYNNGITNTGKSSVISLHDLHREIIGYPPYFWADLVTAANQMHVLKAASDTYSKLKKRLPYVTSGTNPNGKRGNASFISNGLIQIDIDFKQEHEAAYELAMQGFSAICENPSICITAISPSQQGIKAWIYVSATPSEIATNFKGIEAQAIDYLVDFTGIDKKYFDSLSLSQPCFIPYDKQAHFNPTPQALKVNPTKYPTKANKAPNTSQGKPSKVNYTNAIQAAFTHLQSISGEYGDGKKSRHEWLFTFACFCNKYGVDYEVCLAYCHSHFYHEIYTKQNYIRQVGDAYARNGKDHAKWANRLAIPSVQKSIVYENPNNDYVSNLNITESLNRKTLVAGEGIGKTTATMLHYLSESKQIIYIAPTQALAKSQYRKWEKNGFRTHLTMQGKPPTSSENADIICTTIHSLPSVFHHLMKQQVHLTDYAAILDEIHVYSHGHIASHAAPALNIVKNHFQSFTGITATPIPTCHPLFSSLDTIKITRSYTNRIHIRIGKADVASIIKCIKEAQAKGYLPWVYFNDIETLKEVKLTLEKQGQVGVILMGQNSQKKHPELDHHHANEILAGKSTKGLDFALTTSVSEVGIDVGNDRSVASIFPLTNNIITRITPETISQASRRGRKDMEKHEVYLCGEIGDIDVSEDYGESILRNVYANARNIVDDRNDHLNHLLPTTKFVEYGDTNSFTDLVKGENLVYYNNQIGQYAIDYLAVDNKARSMVASACLKSQTFLLSELAKFGMELSSKVDLMVSEEERAEVIEAEKTNKDDTETKKAKWAEATQIIIENKSTPVELEDYVEAVTDFAEKVSSDYNISDDESLELVKKTATTHAQNVLKKRLQVFAYLNGYNNKVTRATKTFLSEMETIGKLDRSTSVIYLKEGFTSIFSKHRDVNAQSIVNRLKSDDNGRYTMMLARLFFDVHKKTGKVDKYEFESLFNHKIIGKVKKRMGSPFDFLT